MHLYMWKSVYLKAYGRGLILAMAEDEEKARAAARTHFEEDVKTRHEWHFGAFADDYDAEKVIELRALFEEDIKVPATTITTALFVEGSD